MKIAAKKLIGEHDYRNLCKMDVGNGVVNYTRRILDTDIQAVDMGSQGSVWKCLIEEGHSIKGTQVNV